MLSVLVFRINGYLYLRGKRRAARRNGAKGIGLGLFSFEGIRFYVRDGESMKIIACNGSIFLYVT